MGRVQCVRCEKSRCDLVARTFALIAPVDPVLHRVSGSYETIPNAAKHYATHQNMSIGSHGVDSVCSLQKIPTWLRGTKFCINSPVRTVLYRVSCSYETIPNAPKHYATHQNMILGSNGVDLLRSLRKIPTWLRCTNFCINFTSSIRFAPSFMQLRNDTKCIQTLCNVPKHESRVQWGGLAALVKNPDVTSWHELLH